MKFVLDRQERIALWLAWAAPFALYAYSAYRSVGFWDIGEMDTVPWILGIAHPTGFPAYVMLGWVFTHVVPFGTVAYRMGLFSGLTMSLAAWLIARIVTEEYDAPWTGMWCAWLFAVGEIVWTRGTRAEVHSFAAMAIAATLYLALRWYRTGDVRAFVFGALAWGIGLATHPVALLIAPGLIVLLIARIRTVRIATLALAVGVCIVTVAGCYAYLPLRSAYVTAHRLDPTRALGLAPGQAFWDNDHPSTPAGFLQEVTGADFDVNDGLGSSLSADTYLTGMPHYFVKFFTEFSIVGGVLILLGILASFRRDGVRAVALVLIAFATVTFGLGFSDEGDPDRYFLASYVVAAILAGDAVMWVALHDRPWLRWFPAALLAICTTTVFVHDPGTLGQPRDQRASRMVDRVLEQTPPDAIIFSSWTDATPLAYAAYVEQRVDGRIIVDGWMSDDADDVRRWARTRPVYVVGPNFGEVPGYHLETVSFQPAISMLVANRPYVSKKRDQ